MHCIVLSRLLLLLFHVSSPWRGEGLDVCDVQLI
jgi:hypothetical protein